MIKLAKGWPQLTAEQLIRDQRIRLGRSVLARASGRERIHVARRSEHPISAD